MVERKVKQLNRDDWIHGTLELLSTTSIEGVKIVHLAKYLGVTSGGFYWYFKNRRVPLDALLDYWEREMTNAAKEAAKDFDGPQRIVSGILWYKS